MSNPPPARSGKILLIFTGLSLIVIGSVFIWLMARSYLRAREMHDWPRVPCTILSASIDERRHDPHSPPEFMLRVVYGYEWQGEALSSDAITLRGGKWSSKQRQVEARLSSYPPGSRQECHVNPTDPRQAVLEPDSLAPGYSIWFPALFVIGGMGMVIRTLR